MDAYGWITIYTSTRELHTQLCKRLNTSDKQRPQQPPPPDYPPQRSRLRLALGDLLITAGRRLLTARTSTAPSAASDMATTREPTAIE